MYVVIMRIILRIFAIIVWLAIIFNLLLLWRIWRAGTFALMVTGPLGLFTVLGWALIIAVGPFAAVQLWRLRENGRRASLLLSGYTLLYYFAMGLSFQQQHLATSKVWLWAGANAYFVMVLLSPTARRACRADQSEYPRISK